MSLSASDFTFDPPTEFGGDRIDIDCGLQIPDVEKGMQVSWRIHLDDDLADVCSPSAEDQTYDTLSIPLSHGEKNYSKHDDNLNFTIFWRLA